MAKGILYGVSTGPGEPELITIKAIECIRGVDVIAAPRTKNKNSMALDIVKKVCDLEGKTILYLDFAMKRDESILKTTHEIQAEQIAEYLDKGMDVAMLNIGDASLFGTYCYIRDIVSKQGYRCETIAGVTSFCACAAQLGQSLTTMNKPLTIIPGGIQELDKMLDIPGTKVLMKSASALPEVISLLDKKGLSDKTTLVANCGLENEIILKNIHEATGEEGYFVTLLISE